MRRFYILSLIFLFGFAFCLTNGFADENGDPVEIIIPDEGFKFPAPEGPADIPDLLEVQIGPESIIDSPDFEKMRDLPTNSRDYQLGRKVGWIIIPVRNEPGAFWSCTGFLVGPDLFMTNHHCLHDGAGLLRISGVRIFMDYYQDLTVDRTRGGITARVSAVVEMDKHLDYALLRLDKSIGNTYGWLTLDTTIDPDDYSQRAKIIQHPDARSKEIVRRNSQILALTPDSRARFPSRIAYHADTQSGSSGSPVFLKDGTGVIAIHHTSIVHRFTGVPDFNVGTLMSHIVPKIQQYLPSPPPPAPSPVATTLEVVSGGGQSARVNQRLANSLVVRVKDQNDAVMSGVSVSFSVTPGGTVSPSSATTGSNGEAETRLTLGGIAGTYTVTARVSGITQPVTFTATATVPAPNPLAFSPNTIAAQTFTVGTAVSLSLPIATGGTAPYTYSLSRVPAGLSFSSATRTLSGTPSTAAAATSITYTVRDAAERNTSLTFTITVSAPLTFTSSEIAAQTFTVGTAVSLSLPIATGGTGSYTYSLSPIPAGLSFSSATRTLSGTPTTAAAATSITYTVRDAAERNTSLTFTITVSAPPAAEPESPDLVIETPLLSNDSLLRGDSFTLSMTVRNRGTANAPATTLRFYQSTDTTTTQVGSADVAALNPDGTAAINITLNAPITLGTYHYEACVDAVANENDSENNCSPSVTLTVSDTLPVYMYWTDSGTDKIQRADLDGSNIKDIVTTGFGTPTSIAVDLVNSKMYWTDSGTDKIQRANFNGSNIEDLVSTGLRTPAGIAVDLVNSKMYWTDSGTDKIQRANFNGSNIEDLVTSGLRTPAGIAVDLVNSKIYWTDTGTDKIQRADLDGSNIEDLVSTGLRTPTGIAVDLVNSKMYWTDTGADKIQRADLDGSNIEDLVTTGLRTPTSIAVDLVNSKMYWTDTGTDKIQRADLDGSNIEDLVSTGLRTPTSIALGIPQVVPPSPPGPAPGPLDVNGDGQVTSMDLVAVALLYGTQVPAGMSLRADVNADGVVDILDITAVAQGIDTAGGGIQELSLEAVEAALLAAIEQPADIEVIAEAPIGFSTPQHVLREGIYNNVADALADARHFATGDVLVVLERLLQLLSEIGTIPEATALLPNYPNPFNPETWIPYHLSEDAAVILTIYDVRGVLVRSLTLGHQPAGVYENRGRAAYWDGRNAQGEKVSSGVYFYTLTADDFTATRKLLIIK